MMPEHDPGEPRWGSDHLADALRHLGIPYISLNPGASYRGLHDSLVNHLGNTAPEMLLCLHEEHAVAIAHGYAKITDAPMAVAIHSNVGLMHASMAIFNAFCDRVPMLLIGATGPVDAGGRRPWIDWLHTTADQAALVRHFTKWDDQPVSVDAAVTALARAYALTATRPSAPTYVCLDVATQEGEHRGAVDLAALDALRLPVPAQPSAAAIEELLEAVGGAQRPLILLGRVGRDRSDWKNRIALAEALGAPVLTHQKLGAAFPTAHPLHPLDPVTHRSPEALRLLGAADLVLSFDWLDLGGMLFAAGVHRAAEGPRVISVSNDARLHNGWSKDHFDFPHTALSIECDPDAAIAALVAGVPASGGTPVAVDLRALDADAAEDTGGEEAREGGSEGAGDDEWSRLRLDDLAAAVLGATEGSRPSFIRLPSGWPAGRMRWDDPWDYLGRDGGEGIGSGPGMAIGGALALRGTGRLPVAIIGDGDCAMGCNALWTAAHHDIAVLVIVANNSSYLNDEIHQTVIARRRDRPVSNAWIGQRMTDPPLDFAGLARAQGWQAHGPIRDGAALTEALAAAVRATAAGGRVLVDVRIEVELDRLPRVTPPEKRSQEA